MRAKIGEEDFKLEKVMIAMRLSTINQDFLLLSYICSQIKNVRRN